MSTSEASSGVSKCYIFKTWLQEHAIKVGFPAPIYETSRDRDDSVRSTVIINGVKYNSLPGFSNRKTAEQSASEIALIELAKSNGDKKCVPVVFYEMSSCKMLLQEYARKMNYAIPVYKYREEKTGGETPVYCSIEIGGMVYVGGTEKTRREAEVKATRTAMLTIQSCTSESFGLYGGNFELTVLPPKKPKKGQSKWKRKPNREVKGLEGSQ